MSDTEHQVDGEVQIVDVTITAPDADWLRQHCAMLIEQRLAASANIIPVIDSSTDGKAKFIKPPKRMPSSTPTGHALTRSFA